MNVIKENIVLVPEMKADKSGVIRQRYSNALPFDYTGLNYTGLDSSNDFGGSSSSSSSNSNGFSLSNTIQGWVETVSGLFTNITGFITQNKYGTDSFNQVRIAEANAMAAANAKQNNSGLIIAVVVLALLMVVGFVILIAKK